MALEKTVRALEEAVAIAQGERPAARITISGFHYVPEADARQLEAEIERLRAALQQIMRDDERCSHPCWPNEYGHFGRIAQAAITDQQSAPEKS